MPLLVAAPLVSALGGLHAAFVSLAVVAVALVAGVAVHALGILGGGDVKLFAGVAGLAGFPLCITFALCAALCGGILALGVAIAGRDFGGTVRRVGRGVSAVVTTRSLAAGTAAIDTSGARIPYAIAIGAGFVIAALIQNSLTDLRIFG